MRALLAAAVVASLLAGCASPPAQQAGASSTPSPAATPCQANATCAPAPRLPVPVAIDLGWDGKVSGAVACTDAAGCTPFVNGGADNQRFHNVTAEGRLRSATLTLAWSAQSPATERLRLGLMIMDHCGGCNVTMLQEVEGTSPLTLNVTGLDHGVGERNWLHAFVRNAATRADAGPAAAYATPDQPFAASGRAIVQPHPAP